MPDRMHSAPGARAPVKPGQTVQGYRIVQHLDVRELVLLELLYRLATHGAAAQGDAALAEVLDRDRADLTRRIHGMAELNLGKVHGHA